MPIFSRLIFEAIRWKSRHRLCDKSGAVDASKRSLGYVFVARNYMPRGGAKGEVDRIGYDGETLAFVGVRTRTVGAQLTTLPELSVTAEKRRVVARMAHRFLTERHVKDIPSASMSSASTTSPASRRKAVSTKTPSILRCNAICFCPVCFREMSEK